MFFFANIGEPIKLNIVDAGWTSLPTVIFKCLTGPMFSFCVLVVIMFVLLESIKNFERAALLRKKEAKKRFRLEQRESRRLAREWIRRHRSKRAFMEFWDKVE